MNKTYTETYPHLISFCANNHPYNLQTFLQACLMVYGWMPTSFKVKGNLEKSIEATNKILHLESPEKKLLTIAHESTNNSFVGLSKLLHFSKPEVFPIWDSKIAELQFNLKYQYSYNKPDAYIRYYKLVHSVINTPKIEAIRQFAEQEIPYKVSDVRAVEYYIFNGKKIA